MSNNNNFNENNFFKQFVNFLMKFFLDGNF